MVLVGAIFRPIVFRSTCTYTSLYVDIPLSYEKKIHTECTKLQKYIKNKIKVLLLPCCITFNIAYVIVIVYRDTSDLKSVWSH